MNNANKLLSLLAVAAIAVSSNAFAAGGKDGKTGGKTPEQIKRAMKEQRDAAQGLRAGGNTAAITSAKAAASNAFNVARVNVTGDAFKRAVDGTGEAVAAGLLKESTLNEFSSEKLEGVDREIGVAALDLIAVSALNSKLSKEELITTNAKKEKVNMLTFLEGEAIAAIKNQNWGGDKSKLLGFLRDAKQEIENGRSFKDAMTKGLERLGRSWDDFVKACLRV